MSDQFDDGDLIDRRKHHKVRGIFHDALERVEHFFHRYHDWVGSPIDYLAHRHIHESYPDLGHDEVRILTSAAIERRVQEGLATARAVPFRSTRI